MASRGAGASAGLPATAVPWVAQYTLEVSGGSQNGSWTEHHQPQGGCDAGETGSGSEDVTLKPSGTAPVFATGVGVPPRPDCGVKSEPLSLWFIQQSNTLHFEQPDGSAPGDPFTDCPYLSRPEPRHPTPPEPRVASAPRARDSE